MGSPVDLRFSVHMSIGPMSSSHEIGSSRPGFYRTAAGIRFFRTTTKNFKSIIPDFMNLDLIASIRCYASVIQSDPEEVALLGVGDPVLATPRLTVLWIAMNCGGRHLRAKYLLLRNQIPISPTGGYMARCSEDSAVSRMREWETKDRRNMMCPQSIYRAMDHGNEFRFSFAG